MQRLFFCLLCVSWPLIAQERDHAQGSPTSEMADSSKAAEHAEQQKSVQRSAAQDLPVPRIPPIVIPDVLGKTPQQVEFESRLPIVLQPDSGLRIEPARCEGDRLIHGHWIQERTADTARQIKPDSILQVRADGSGEMLTPEVNLRVQADGSGQLVRNFDSYNVIVRVNADGSGEYTGPEGHIQVDGQGGGKWVSGTQVVHIRADGSGEWVNGENVVRIRADGSGEWVSAQMQRNYGDGTGSYGVPPQTVVMAPWPPAPKVGSFDLFRPFTMPGDVCGYVITLDERVLFDFDKYDVRADAAQTLGELAEALVSVQANSVEIGGHTDSKGTQAYNQTLSENRARSVQEALQQRGVTTPMHVQGYGESRPLAPNDVDGKDSPANRQLNRRVEIFVKVQ